MTTELELNYKYTTTHILTQIYILKSLKYLFVIVHMSLLEPEEHATLHSLHIPLVYLTK